MRDFATVILAAGKGTRMKSDLHKVLHPIAGRAMLDHLLDSFEELAPAATVVVAGDRHEQLREALANRRASVVLQEPQLGTAHAALQAKGALVSFEGLVLVCFGDCPMVKADTVRRLCDAVDDTTSVAVLGFRPKDTLAYGRIIADSDGTVRKMVEHKDANEEERACNLCNSGVLVAHSKDIWRLLESVGNDNVQGEYYLPDVATNAIAEGGRVVAVETDPAEVAGINSRIELAEVERQWQEDRRKYFLANGVTLQSPETTFFAWDTQIGSDATVQPNVVFENAVRIGKRCTIEANLIIPGNSDVPDDTLVSRENLHGFTGSTLRSSHWTGRFTLSDRAMKVVQIGPGAIRGLSQIIAEIEQRNHNGPPAMLAEGSLGEILPDLKELQKRLRELVDNVERQHDPEAGLKVLEALFKSKIAPWFKSRLGHAARTANGFLAMSFVYVPTYLALSRILDPAMFTSVMGGLAAGMVTQSVPSMADQEERKQ